MKITTWNVNGLRAALNKGASDWWRVERPDILCLQEIKVKPGQLSEKQLALLDGAPIIWNPAQRKGYSGVATISEQQPLEVVKGMNSERFDL